MKQKSIKPKSRAWRLWSCLLLLTVIPYQAMADSPVSAEYQLKAALIYKLTKFVEWPETGSEKPHDNFGICVLGRDDFGSALDVLEERMVGNIPISVRRFKQSDAIGQYCQLIFISDSKQAFFRSILHSLAPHPILTISDSTKFAEKGGMIQLTRGDKRIGFKINLQSANNSGLKIAAPLLELATIIEGGGQ